MSWVKIDDHFDEHPKLAKVGPLGWALWFAGLAYCNRNLTDGFIPWSKAHGLVTWSFLRPHPEDGSRELVWNIGVATGMHGNDVDSAYVIGLLLDVGLWDDCDGGYVIHDYADYQPTREQVLAEREKKQAAGRAGGQASAQARAQAPAQAKSKPVPVPVPVPDASNEASSSAREVDDGRLDLEAWLLVKHRAPSPAQRRFLDRYLDVFDLTGPQRAERLILANPDDPIAAMKADLDAFRAERLATVEKAEVKPRPIRDPRGSYPSATKELLAAWAAAAKPEPAA